MKSLKPLLPVLFMAVLVFSVAVTPVLAEDYPKKPITCYIPLSAGGTSDVFVRTLQPYMEEYLGQQLILINKPGSNGALAVTALSKADPDGYTMSWANLPTVVTHPQMRELQYDPEDFVYIASPMHYDYIFYVRDDAPWNTLGEFISYVKDNQGTVTYGTPGIGSTNHLAVAWLANNEGLDMRAVPFKGNPKSIAAVLGGHVTACNTSTTASVSSYRAGKLKPLAVMSASRIDLIPDTPTLQELGYDFYQFSCLGALFPSGTPEHIRSKFEKAIKFAVEQEEVIKKAKDPLFVSIDFKDGKEYRELSREYWDIWGSILDQLDLKKK
jgi:tripartite-type tricarboxylate transporter receptor subunit TctC